MVQELHPALTATGRFRVKDCLGSGGFGVVFAVYDNEVNANVALKWLRNSDASTLARFKREFRSLADLLHPNLVGFRELITVAGEWFFTMDLVEGVELLRYVRPVADVEGQSYSQESTSVAAAPSSNTMQVPASPVVASPRPSQGRSPRHPDLPLDGHRPLCRADLRRVRVTLEQLTSGLDALHAAGMIHRDIKPSNVLVTHDGRVVILDLGLVTELRDGIAMTQTGHVVGTPAYMSPEQASGAPCTPASDWYSVGVILYQALTGRIPFDTDPRSLLINKQFKDALSPNELVRGVPKALSELCLELLSRAPERRPIGAQFLERLRQAIPIDRPSEPAKPAKRSTAMVPGDFVGREAHVWALEEALDEAEKGSSVISFVHGRSGMGKTALIRHFLDGIRRERPDTLVLEGRCYERESVPYKGVDSLVDSLCRYLQRLPEVEAAKLMPRDLAALARVFPVFHELDAPGRRSRTRIDAVQERRRAFEALRELISRIADRSLVVLFIDDLQWGDGDSEPLLVTLFRAPDPPPLLLIAAYRTEDTAASPLVDALRRLASSGPVEACEIPVTELTPEAAEELATALLNGRGDVKLPGAIARESCGSPLFLRQLAALRQTGVEEAYDLATALSQRVEALPPPARRLLEVLAVAGKPLALGSAARAAGVEEDVQGILAKLRVETLVRTRGADARDEVEIYHDRIREVVVANLGEEKLKTLHRKLAGVLSGSGDADPEALALHFSAADERGLAADYAEKAADRATEALAFTRAAEMYEMALGLTSTLGRNSDSLLTKLAEALVSAGRGRDAADRFLQAARSASPSDALELRRRAAEQLLFSGHIDEGLRVVDQILAAMNIRAPKTAFGVICSLLWRRFLLLLRGLRFRERSVDAIPRDHLVRIDTYFSLGLGLGMFDPARGADFQTRYLLLALRAGEPLRIAKAFALEAAYRASDGLKAKPMVDRLVVRATELAQRVGQPHAIALTTLMNGIARVFLAEYAKGIVLCDRAYSELREKCTGVAWELDNAAFFACFSLVWCGRTRELQERLPALLDDTRARGDLYGEVFLRMQCVYFVELCKDNPEAARLELASIPEEWNRGRFLLQNVWQLVNRVDVELYARKPLAAWQLLTEGWPRVERSLFLRPEAMRVRAKNARGRAAVAAAGHVTDASKKRALLAIASTTARELSRESFPLARGYSLLLDAGVLAVKGEKGAAIDRLRDAIAELESREAWFYALSARFRLGQLLGGDEGRAAVERATKELTAESVADPEAMSFVFAPFSIVRSAHDTPSRGSVSLDPAPSG